MHIYNHLLIILFLTEGFLILCDVERGPRWLKPFVALGTDTGAGECWKREEREGAVDAEKRRGGVMLGGNCSRGRTVADAGEGWCRQDELIWSCRLVLLRGKQKPSATATFTDPTCDAVKSSILPFLAEKALLQLHPWVRALISNSLWPATVHLVTLATEKYKQILMFLPQPVWFCPLWATPGVPQINGII